MHKLILTSLLAAFTFGSIATAEAKSKKHYYRDGNDGDYRGYHDKKRNRYGYGERSRNIYVIERNRPVRRVVYTGDNGRYYRMVEGRRSYVTGRYYNSYPSQYYYSNGRPRVGISVSF